MTTEYICRLIDSEDADVMVFRPIRPLVRCRDCMKSADENANGCYCHSQKRCRDCMKSADENANGCYCHSQKRYRDPDGFCDEGMGAE